MKEGELTQLDADRCIVQVGDLGIEVGKDAIILHRDGESRTARHPMSKVTVFGFFEADWYQITSWNHSVVNGFCKKGSYPLCLSDRLPFGLGINLIIAIMIVFMAANEEEYNAGRLAVYIVVIPFLLLFTFRFRYPRLYMLVGTDRDAEWIPVRHFFEASFKKLTDRVATSLATADGFRDQWTNSSGGHHGLDVTMERGVLRIGSGACFVCVPAASTQNVSLTAKSPVVAWICFLLGWLFVALGWTAALLSIGYTLVLCLREPGESVNMWWFGVLVAGCVAVVLRFLASQPSMQRPVHCIFTVTLARETLRFPVRVPGLEGDLRRVIQAVKDLKAG